MIIKMENNQKLITVVREDLTTGYQAVQSCHAAIGFIMTFPEMSKEWYEVSNHLCQLSITNEKMLRKLYWKAKNKGIKVVEFKEIDLNNELTAIALEPSKEARKLVQGLKLMLS